MISPVLIFVSIVKWQVLLKAKTISVPLFRLFGLYLIGYFFNYLLPSNVGGDVIRGAKLGNDTGKMEETLASVFFERMTGFTTLLVFAFLVLSFNFRSLGDPLILGALGLTFVGYLGVLWMAFDPHPLAICNSIPKVQFLSKLAQKIQRLQAAIRSYRDNSEVWLPVAVLSVMFYLLAIVNVYLGCLAFGVQVSLTALTKAVPFIMVISMIPISLGGVGLQEWSYFTVFEHVGIPSPLGISVALLMRAKGILLGSVGGLCYAKWLTRGK